MAPTVTAINLDEYADMLGDLDNADEPRLNEFHERATARVDELRPKIEKRELSDDELAELAGLTPALRDVTGQRRTRADTRESKYGEAEAFLSEFDAANAEPETTTPEELAEGEDAETEDESGEQAEGDGGEAAPQQAMAAAAGKSTKPAKRTSSTTTRARVPEIGTTGAQANNGPRPIHPQVAMVAACHQSKRDRGAKMEFGDLGEAMSERLRGLRNGGGDGSQDAIMSLRASGVPDARFLKRGSVGENTNKLDAVTSRTALTAAGGLCAPLAIDYSYNTIGVQGRPVRDSLPGFQADRGGIMYRRDVSPVTNASNTGPRSATGIWTNESDENAYAASNPPRKAVWYVDCPDTETAEVEAITLQTEWSNVSSRFDPETVQANQAAALIWHDRFAENHLLDQLQAKSKVATSAQLLGATADVLVTLDRAQAYYRSVHRLGADVQLRAIMPFWVCHMIRADLARRMSLGALDNLAVSDAQITTMLQTRGLNPVWHLDGDPGVDNMGTTSGNNATDDDTPAQQYTLASAGAAVKPFPTKVDILLHTEGHFTHLDGGTLDLGIVRDSELISRNRYRQFSETWEGVATRGVEALRLIASVAPTGETAGTVDVPATGF